MISLCCDLAIVQTDPGFKIADPLQQPNHARSTRKSVASVRVIAARPSVAEPDIVQGSFKIVNVIVSDERPKYLSTLHKRCEKATVDLRAANRLVL